MKAEKIIRLRIQNSTFCRRIRVVQGDTGRIFRFILEDVTMDGSEQARVYAKKPDGTEVYNDCEVVSPNEVLMESDSGQIFAAIGVVQAEIQISKSGKTITTYTFEFDVEISLTRAGAIQSSSEYGALEAAIAKAEGFYNPTFAEAKTRDNINSGESIPTLFGKVKKWFTDLNTLIKLVGSTDISGIGNGTVTDALSVLNSKPIVKHGLINNIECPANTITTVPLVYDTPFPRYPIIIPCFRSSTTMIEYGVMQIFVDADGYEKSGCNLKIANNSKYNLKPSINWIAASYQ